MYNSLLCDEKIINNIEPFNDIWYGECFFSSLFPIINHFNGSITSIITNDIFAYSYKDELGVPIIDLIPKEKLRLDIILKDINIGMKCKLKSMNVINDLCNAIINEHPVIILVDCFYEPFRTDTYNTRHVPHSILIYGYNNKDNYFNILEHTYLDSVIYEKQLINYSDLNNSYSGYLNNYFTKTSPSFIECFKTNTNLEHNEIYYINNFKNKVIEKRDFMIESLKDIDKFSESFLKFVSNTDINKFKDKSFLSSLNRIVNNKNFERYRFLKIFGYNEIIISYIEQVIRNWNTIRGIIAKYEFTSEIKGRALEVIAEKLSSVKNIELMYYNSICEYFKKDR